MCVTGTLQSTAHEKDGVVPHIITQTYSLQMYDLYNAVELLKVLLAIKIVDFVINDVFFVMPSSCVYCLLSK